ncbi:MAG: glycosyltransferase family 1 protein [Nitrospirota bacterium]
MKIAIDVHKIAGRRSGIGQYTDHIVGCLVKQHQGHRYFLCHYGLHPSAVGRWIQGGDVAAWEHARARGFTGVGFPFRKVARMYSSACTRVVMRRTPVDLFWGPNYRTLVGPAFKTAVTIHDMAHHHYPQYFPRSVLFYLKHRLRGVAARSHLILTDSEHSRRDIVNYLGQKPEKVVVAYPGVDRSFRPLSDPETQAAVRTRYHLPERFLLFLGTLEPRKNLVGLLKAFARARERGLDAPLVLAGDPGWMYRDVFRTIRSEGLEKAVITTGYVRDEDRPALYSMAEVFVYPSFYEGFGLPVLEAMACGTPVITSRVSSLPEVGGEAVRYVDPMSTGDIASAILELWQSDSLRQTLRERGLKQAAGFTWDACARTILSAFEGVVYGVVR